MRHTPRQPKPASLGTIQHAINVFQNDVFHQPGPTEAATFLDRIGFRNLHSPTAVTVFNPTAGHALQQFLPLSVSLAHVTIERLADCDPQVAECSGSSTTVAYWWFSQCAARAAAALPEEDPHSPAYLEFLADIPLCHVTYNYGFPLRKAIIRHLACPDSVLYAAVNEWDINEVDGVADHPNASDDTLTVYALRH